MGQFTGALAGLVAAFVLAFLILTFGLLIPTDIVKTAIVEDFLSRADLELKLAIVSTVLFPTSLTVGVNLSTYVGYGADGGTVLTYLAWGTGGLIAGLLTRDVAQGVLAGIFAVIIGAFLSWLLIFFLVTADYMAIIGGASILILQVVLESSVFPCIAAVIGGLLGAGITRER
ncbi:MAG: hypothetical protein ACTSUO_05790 [Candidatus Thorarchaeota archaeon]